MSSNALEFGTLVLIFLLVVLYAGDPDILDGWIGRPAADQLRDDCAWRNVRFKVDRSTWTTVANCRFSLRFIRLDEESP